MSATSTVGRTRERLKAILDAIPGLAPTRVKLGLVDIAATTDFYNEIVSAGPFATISPADYGDNNLQLKTYDFDVTVKVYVGFANNMNETYVAIEDLMELMRAALSAPASYTSGAAMPYRSFSIERDDEINKSPRVVLYTFKLGFTGA